MNKVINGKRYSTESAHFCGDREYGNHSDLNHLYEVLYQKRTGEFFLFGAGGAKSKYAKAIGANDWYGGEKIIPLTDDEAKKWAEKYLDGEDYENNIITYLLRARNSVLFLIDKENAMKIIEKIRCVM